jgi:opacity protein-like surface antigen
MKRLGLVYLLIAILYPSTIQAEAYIAGQIGALFKTSLTNVERTPGFLDGASERVSDINLSTSPLYGFKLGYFLRERLRWLGGEAEFFRTYPYWVGQQLSTPSFPSGLSPVHMEMNTFAFNLLIRYPFARIQPYGGIGLGLFWANAAGSQGGPTGHSSFTPGLNILAGVRVFLTDSVAVFSEYKYNRTTIDIAGEAGSSHSGFKADYRPEHVVIGIGYHF